MTLRKEEPHAGSVSTWPTVRGRANRPAESPPHAAGLAARAKAHHSGSEQCCQVNPRDMARVVLSQQPGCGDFRCGARGTPTSSQEPGLHVSAGTHVRWNSAFSARLPRDPPQPDGALWTLPQRPGPRTQTGRAGGQDATRYREQRGHLPRGLLLQRQLLKGSTAATPARSFPRPPGHPQLPQTGPWCGHTEHSPNNHTEPQGSPGNNQARETETTAPRGHLDLIRAKEHAQGEPRGHCTTGERRPRPALSARPHTARHSAGAPGIQSPEARTWRRSSSALTGWHGLRGLPLPPDGSGNQHFNQSST